MTIRIVLFLLVILVGYTVQTVTGFGGPLLSMPFGIMLVGIDESKAVLCAIAWMTSTIVAVQNWRAIRWKEVAKMVAGMFFGMLAGLWLYDVAPREIMLFVYGVFTVLMACKNLLVKKEMRLPRWALLLLLPLAGFAQGLFMSGGAFLMIYALEVLPDKREFRATPSAVWGVINLYMIYSQASRGLYTAETVTRLLLPAIGASLCAILLGNYLQSRLNQKKFMLAVNLLLLVTGLTLLFT